MYGSWTEFAVVLSICSGLIWDLSDVLTVHMCSARAQIQYFKDWICALAEQIWTIWTSYRSQMNHNIFLIIMHSQFKYFTLKVTPFKGYMK